MTEPVTRQPKGTVALVFGILSVVCDTLIFTQFKMYVVPLGLVFGIIGNIIGNKYMKRYKSGTQIANTGRILSKIGMIFSIVAIASFFTVILVWYDRAEKLIKSLIQSLLPYSRPAPIDID